MNNIAREIS